MKKNFVKLLSTVMSLMLIMTSLTSVVFATESEERLSVGNGSNYDINIGVSNAKELDVLSPLQNIGNTRGAKDITSGTTTSVNKDWMPLFKFPLPSMELGKTLDKYIIRFASQTTNVHTLVQVKTVPASTDLSESKTDLVTTISGYDNANGSIPLELEKETTFGTNAVKIFTADVSQYATECLNAGQDYFCVGLYATSTTKIYTLTLDSSIKNGTGYNYKDLFPYAYYTTKDAGAFVGSSVVNPVTASDPLEFVFSNPVAPSSVTTANFVVTNLAGENVDVSANEIEVAGATVRLKKTWDAYGRYSVSFSGISDVYGQSLTESCSTNFDIVATGTPVIASPLDTYLIKNDATKIYEGKSANYYRLNAKQGYVLYKFDISTIDKNKAVAGADFKFTSNRTSGTKSIQVLVVPNGTWTDMTTLTSSYDQYYTVVDAAAQSDASIIDTVTHNFSENAIQTSVADVSSAIIEAINNNSSYVTFAFYDPDTTHSFYTKNCTTEAYRPSLTIEQVEPSFDAITTVPEKCGVMDGVNLPIEVTLATSIPEEYANDTFINLVDSVTGNTADVDVVVNGSKLTVIPTSDLSEHREYKLVIKAGTQDAFDNTNTVDKVIHRFTTGTALEFYDIKFTSDASPVYDSVSEITSYTANSKVTAVAKVVNKSGTDLDAIMIIALYGSDNTLISVDAVGGPFSAPKNQTTQYAKTISVPAGVNGTYIKAFVWDDLVRIRPICEHKPIDQAN